ncbi:organic cation transporter protein isoform X2 [Atheta coriaria]
MNFDDILDELGELGRFQIVTYLLICLPVLFSGANSLSYVFTAGIPEYRCSIPGCDNENTTFNAKWMSYAIPLDKMDQPEHCLMYKRTGSGCEVDDFDYSTKLSCDSWLFGKENTIVNEWKLTCRENELLLSYVGNSHFVGIFIGSFLFGLLSDRYGRKYMFLIAIVIMCIAGVGHVTAGNYYMFLAITCIHAIGTAGVYPLGFVIGVELVGRSKRELTGVVLNFFYAFGEALLGVVAYYSQDWRLTQMIVSGPCILFVLYFCYIPESVRWLMAKNKNREASGIITQAAKINKVVLSEGVRNTFTEPASQQSENDEETPMWPMVVDICKTRSLVIRYIVIFIVWGANAFIYYGMSLNATSMGGNKYVNFILVCLIEIPGYLVSWITILKIGRKYSLIGSLFVCAVLCIATAFVPTNLNWLIILLFLLSKLSITCSFGIIYVYTAELFPTIVRSGGVATASTFARFGAFLAPFIPRLGQLWASLPMILFAVIAFMAGALVFKLPETVKRKLPETLTDAININSAPKQ